MDVQIVWDLADDPDGNYQHILDGHDISIEEVEEVLLNQSNETVASKSSGHRATFGWTLSGKYLVVIWEHVQDDPLTIYPVTAYPVPPPRRPKRKRSKR